MTPFATAVARIHAAWNAFQAPPPARPAKPDPAPVIAPETTSDPRVRAASLELDLRDRDAELARLRAEYDRMRAEADRATEAAGEAAVRSLAKHLSGPLAQLVTMQALADAGRELRAADVLQLCARLERAMTDAGLARIGTVGDAAPFDPALHQRMSGNDIDDGAPVTIRFVGYRLGETILQKAMVSHRTEVAA